MLLNQTIFYFLNSFAGRTNLLDSLIIFFAVWLPWILIIITIAYFVFIRKSPAKLFMISAMVLVGASITGFLQWIVFRHPRPFVALANVHQLINISAYTSFPSMHATIFGALATAVFIYNRKIGTIFIIATVLIGAGRIAAGVHFPIDILTGFLIGFIVTYFSYRLFRRMSRAVYDMFS